MTWWPVIIDLLLLIPFILLTRALRLSWRARWFAALLFVAGQLGWSGLLLAAVLQLPALPRVPAILLTWFGRPATARARVEPGDPGERRGQCQSSGGRREILLVHWSRSSPPQS